MEINNVEVTKEDFENWKNLLITKIYLKEIQTKVKDLHLYLGSGGTLDIDNPDKTQGATAKVIGAIEALQDILDIHIEEEV